jgi:preprotein translocase subunit SecE
MSDTTNNGPQTTKRTGPAQFLKEVRTELRRVAWPSRGEVAQYSLIVLVTTILIGAYIFGLDQLFGQLVFWIYG